MIKLRRRRIAASSVIVLVTFSFLKETSSPSSEFPFCAVVCVVLCVDSVFCDVYQHWYDSLPMLVWSLPVLVGALPKLVGALPKLVKTSIPLASFDCMRSLHHQSGR